MSLHIRQASELRTTARNKRVVDFEVSEILKAMNSKMLADNRDGHDHIDFHVPKTFTSIGDDPDIVLTIVTTVIRELKKAGYTLAIRDLEHSYLFEVRWLTTLTGRARDDMEALLREHIIDVP